jgi:alpha-L-rhamnosidase
MTRALGGIELDEDHPGWSRFAIHPRAGSGVTSVHAEQATIRGRIVSAWSRANGAFELEVAIPANTSATVTIPAKDAAAITEGGRPIQEAAPNVKVVTVKDGEATLEVRAGRYKFQART